jgi:signal transduction histidine kinase/DNA-binding response OmpR family regulator
MGILARTALLSWLVTIITMAVFVAVNLPGQKQTFLENLESKARGVSASLQDVAAGAVVTEDYSEVVSHCMEVLSRDETIEFLVLTRNDGFALIHTREEWRNEQQSIDWHPALREAKYGISQPDILDKEVFRYSRPFDYSGIEWGWIHVGLSLDAYRSNLRASYSRTAWLVAFCILMGLVASVVYAKRLVEPILRLRDTAQLVAGGDLSARADVSSGDEVEALADAFNTMTQAVQDREARLRTLNEQLAALVTEKALHEGIIDETARRITEASAETLEVERVGVWLFMEDQSAIECLDQFDRSGRKHERGFQLPRKKYEPYFSALEDTRVLVASDALSDPRTSCLAESYLRPAHVSSMMDAAIRLGGRMVGVICHEHVGESRSWTPEEENFVGSLADLLALALEARDRRAAQRHLVAAKEAAEAANEAKSQFLANMSHEIRTPISGVMGMLQLLDKDELAEKQRRYVTAALSSADTLLTVIGDVLDFSKIEAGHLELDQSKFALREAVDSSVRLFAEKAEAQRIELSYAVAPDVPDKLVGDPNRLRQVLINLVGNAVKFTEAGEVHVDAHRVERSESAVLIHFSVRDTGPGIPREQLDTIFESFAQGDASMQRRHGGTGLGLAISRHLVALMGGELVVNSEPGKGSTFAFTARLALQEDVAEPETRVITPQGLRVLVVDDSETVRDVVCDHIRAWGNQVGWAASASEAMAELQRGEEAKSPYAVALIDSRMPGIDGFSLAKLLRQERRFRSLPLILMAGFKAPPESRLRECGIAGVVSKPVRASDLYDTIVMVANGTSSHVQSLKRENEEHSGVRVQGARVLLVEDNAINREVAQAILSTLGHACDHLATGSEAVAAVISGHYDVVLMDCQMPGMDGYEATERIRAWERKNGPEKHVPIIALTAHAMKGDRERCLAAGMDDYLAKPLQIEELSMTLEKWLGRPGRLAEEVQSSSS